MKRLRTSALLLVLVLVMASVAGCGGNTGSNNQDSTSTQKATTQESTKQVVNEEPYTIKLLGDFGITQNTPLGVETIEKIEKQLNVKFDIEAPPSANYKEKVQIILSSGNLPDIVLFNDTNDPLLRSNVENGNVIEINKYLENAPNIMKYTLPSSLNAVKFLGGDKMYGIVRSTFVRADGISFRSDWLSKLGITGVEAGKPVTLEQFAEIMKKFAENDPDGNSKKDTYGFSLSAGNDGELVSLYSLGSIDVISGAFGLNGWQKYTGEDYEYMDLRFSKKSDQFKKLLEYVSAMYKNKWLDPDWPTIKAPQAGDNFIKGKYGAQVNFPLHVVGTVDALKKVNPEAEITWASGILNAEAGKVTGTTFSTGAWGCWAITKTCTKPEKVVQVFDYMLSDEMYPDQMIYGGEGSGYKLENGKKVGLPLYMDNPDTVGFNQRFMRRAGDPSVYITLKMDDKAVATGTEWLTIAAANAVISKDGGYVPPASLEPKFIDYKKKMNETITRILVGELPVSAYDEALDGWYKAGGEDYVKQMNESIKALAK